MDFPSFSESKYPQLEDKRRSSFKLLNLIDMDLSNSDYSLSEFPDIKIVRSNFSGSVFSHSIMRGAQFFGDCIFTFASFKEANLVNAIFTDCNLTRVDFSMADLRAAQFIGCNLQGANMEKANLDNVILRDCTLHQINLSESKNKNLVIEYTAEVA